MNIYEIEEYAKQHGYNSLRFKVKMLGTEFEGNFLDAYYGFIQIPVSGDGFMRLIDIKPYDPIFTVIE